MPQTRSSFAAKVDALQRLERQLGDFDELQERLRTVEHENKQMRAELASARKQHDAMAARDRANAVALGQHAELVDLAQKLETDCVAAENRTKELQRQVEVHKGKAAAAEAMVAHLKRHSTQAEREASMDRAVAPGRHLVLCQVGTETHVHTFVDGELAVDQIYKWVLFVQQRYQVDFCHNPVLARARDVMQRQATAVEDIVSGRTWSIRYVYSLPRQAGDL